ncbi:hypothetical protein PG989_009565 [Apiospora arundinis]
MASLFISRIISMRDADGPRRKPAVSSKTYAMASHPDLYDDSESDDADDEYETGDEYLVISSSDTAGEQDQARDCESNWYEIATEDDSDSLETIEDYFNDPNIVPYQEFHHDLLNSNEENEENDLPVIQLNLANSLNVAANNGTTTNVLDDAHDAPQKGPSALKQQDEKQYDGAERWSLVSASFSSNWACELEAALEDNIVHEGENITVSKVRQPSQSTATPIRSARSGRLRDRKVAFTLRPNVFGDLSS